MRARYGLNLWDGKDGAEHTLSPISPTSTSTSGLSSSKTASWYMPPVREKRPRSSLLSRLRSLSISSRSSSPSPSSSSFSGVDLSFRRRSVDWRQSPKSSPHDQSESSARSVLSRGGRMLRRHGSKLTLSSFIINEDSELGSMEVSETCQRAQHSPKSRRPSEDLKEAISPPFHFHHITHTQPRQFEKLDRGSHNELVTEFVAIRASQRATCTLQGIQASDLRQSAALPDSASDTFCQLRDDQNMLPSPSRLRHPSEPAQTSSASPASDSPTTGKGLRPSLIENFSRPAPWKPMTPQTPPPRTSSRNALNCPVPPAGLTGTSTHNRRAQSASNILSRRQSGLAFNLDEARSYKPIAKVGASVETTKPAPPPRPATASSSTPTAAADEVGSILGTANEGEQDAAKVGLSRSSSLRHARLLPSATVLSEHNHLISLSTTDHDVAQSRPESSQSDKARRWEDDVDFCYDNAAESDCNFDWNQKSVYVDGDVDSVDASTARSDRIGHKELISREKPSSESGKCKSAPAPNPSPSLAARREAFPKPTSADYARELEECLSPFSRHQAAKEFRGYQHWSQTASKAMGKLCVVSSETTCVEADAFLDKELCDNAGLELPTENLNLSDRCFSGASSSSPATTPTLSTQRSNGSMLSSRASTIRTYRSSNSVGSVPDLVFSRNNSRESVAVEKSAPADSVQGGSLPPIPRRITSASRPPPNSCGPSRELPPIPHASAISPRPTVDKVKKVPCAPPSRPGTSSGISADMVKTEVEKNHAPLVSKRKRSASAVTLGPCLRARASYCLFPPPDPTVQPA